MANYKESQGAMMKRRWLVYKPDDVKGQGVGDWTWDVSRQSMISHASGARAFRVPLVCWLEVEQLGLDTNGLWTKNK